MSIKDDIEALEKALEVAEWTGQWYDSGCNTVMCNYNGTRGIEHGEIAHPEPLGAASLIVACSPDRIRRLLDALKECQKWHQAARLLHEPREAKLSRAIELLKAVAEHGSVIYTAADGRVETLNGRIVAFLKEAGHE